MTMAQDDAPMNDELEDLQQQLANARENLRFIQVRISEYTLAQNVPLDLRKNERRLKREINQLQEDIREIKEENENVARGEVTSAPIAEIAQRSATVTIQFRGHIDQWDDGVKGMLIKALIMLLGILTDEIEILSVTSGSIRVELKMPEEAALKLEEMYRNNDPALEQLGMQVLHVEVDTFERALIDVLRNAGELARASADVITLNRKLDLDLTNASARDFSRAFSRALNRTAARAVAQAKASDRADAINRALERASASTRDFARTSDRVRVRVRDLASALGLLLASDPDLDPGLDHDRAHDHARALFAIVQGVAEAELGAEHPEVITFKHTVAAFEARLRESEEEAPHSQQQEESKRGIPMVRDDDEIWERQEEGREDEGLVSGD
jgi:hypothetical protein